MDKIQDESENDREKSSGSDYSANLQYSTSYSYSYYDWAARVLHFSAFILLASSVKLEDGKMTAGSPKTYPRYKRESTTGKDGCSRGIPQSKTGRFEGRTKRGRDDCSKGIPQIKICHLDRNGRGKGVYEREDDPGKHGCRKTKGMKSC